MVGRETDVMVTGQATLAHEGGWASVALLKSRYVRTAYPHNNSKGRRPGKRVMHIQEGEKVGLGVMQKEKYENNDQNVWDRENQGNVRVDRATGSMRQNKFRKVTGRIQSDSGKAN